MPAAGLLGRRYPFSAGPAAESSTAGMRFANPRRRAQTPARFPDRRRAASQKNPARVRDSPPA